MAGCWQVVKQPTDPTSVPSNITCLLSLDVSLVLRTFDEDACIPNFYPSMMGYNPTHSSNPCPPHLTIINIHLMENVVISCGKSYYFHEGVITK